MGITSLKLLADTQWEVHRMSTGEANIFTIVIEITVAGS